MSADPLGQLDDDPLRAAHVTEAKDVPVALDLANEFRAAGSQAGYDRVYVVDRECEMADAGAFGGACSPPSGVWTIAMCDRTACGRQRRLDVAERQASHLRHDTHRRRRFDDSFGDRNKARAPGDVRGATSVEVSSRYSSLDSPSCIALAAASPRELTSSLVRMAET